MTDSEAASNGKHQKDEESNCQQINDTPTKEVRLTNLIEDCLEPIFMKLSIENLVAIVHTNKQLKPAAASAFARKFGTMKIVLSNLRHNLPFDSKKDSIRVVDLNVSLRLLRSFGHRISKLHIGHKNSMGSVIFSNGLLINYANKYCKSLVEITFGPFANTDLSLAAHEPFPMVETVRFWRCNLRRFGQSEFDGCFPEIRRLEFVGNVPSNECIVDCLPNLEHLVINGSLNRHNNDTIPISLALNPQLLSLTLKSDDALFILRKGRPYLGLLESLSVTYDSKDLMNVHFGFEVNEVIQFESLRKLEVNFTDLFCDSIPHIPFSSHRLEELEVSIGNCEYKTFNRLVRYLQKHQNITKFTLIERSDSFWEPSYISEESKMNISEAMLSLEEADFWNIEFSTGEVKQFIGNCKTLHRFGFKFINGGDFNDLKKRLGSEWEASIDPNGNVKIVRI
ncbi:uncharacterized protein LOC129580189 [Sitodiplosis mosellana]|uniref:uncharacterized protein LOC129571640 n=1 Tax=Sitodiplosis mosellana TaxID=263140 RepID=UPI0024450041|nr:uncharacterized protein LOC129571640 [Sitodiplosis mosellana]XP_055326370.1 uncharacterized protein LOC129580189 [Sitodiplosis mosellana]